MKIFKIVFIVIWIFITFGLVIYSQTLKNVALKKERVAKEYLEMNKNMINTLDEYYENMVLLQNDSAQTIDIDSLFKSSFFLTKYKEQINNNR